MATRTEPSTVDRRVQLLVDDVLKPDTYDIDLATRVVRVHCRVMQYPATERCLNCGWPFPCVTYRWGRGVLVAAGWSTADIEALDTRTGVWT